MVIKCGQKCWYWGRGKRCGCASKATTAFSFPRPVASSCLISLQLLLFLSFFLFSSLASSASLLLRPFKATSQPAPSVCFWRGGSGLHYVEPNLTIPMIVVTLAIRSLIETKRNRWQWRPERKNIIPHEWQWNVLCCAVWNPFLCVQVNILGAILFILVLLFSIFLDSVMKACCTWGIVSIRSVDRTLRARVHVFCMSECTCRL